MPPSCCNPAARSGASLPLRVIELIAADSTLLGLGDLHVKRVSSRAGRVNALLEGADEILYVVDLQRGPLDDRQIVRLLERWAAERQQRGLGWVDEARPRGFSHGAHWPLQLLLPRDMYSIY